MDLPHFPNHTHNTTRNSTESKYMSLFLCSVVVLSCFSYLLGTMDKFKCVRNPFFPKPAPITLCLSLPPPYCV